MNGGDRRSCHEADCVFPKIDVSWQTLKSDAVMGRSLNVSALVM